MLQLRKILCLFVTLLLLVQPVFATEESSTTPVDLENADIVSAVRTVSALPSNWNPLSAPNSEKQWLLQQTSAPVYRFTAEGTWEPVLAQNLPEDVTAEFAGTFGIPATATGGYAYRISLNPSACWEDGQPITADDYRFSIQKLLEDEENRENWTFLANAKAILSGKSLPSQEIVTLRSAGFTSLSEAKKAGYTDFYLDTTTFWGLDGGWRSIADRSRLQDFAMPSGMNERFVSPAYLFDYYLSDGAENSRLQREFIGIRKDSGKTMTMEDLGVLSTDSYELTLILQKAAAPSTLMQKLEHLYLFRKSFWRKNYATSPETYCGYGPYRITAVDSSQIILQPNPNWWGTPVAGDFDRILCRAAGKD